MTSPFHVRKKIADLGLKLRCQSITRKDKFSDRFKTLPQTCPFQRKLSYPSGMTAVHIPHLKLLLPEVECMEEFIRLGDVSLPYYSLRPN